MRADAKKLRAVVRESRWAGPEAREPRNRSEEAEYERDLAAAIVVALVDGVSTPGLCDATVVEAFFGTPDGWDVALRRLVLAEWSYQARYVEAGARC